MPIADDWDFNYSAKVLSHIDGVLSYDGGNGRAPVVGEYVYGNVSRAYGKVLAITGNVTAADLTLTNVVGYFQDNETIEILSELGFDGVVDGQGGFLEGDTVSSTTGSIDVKAIEYNADGSGEGILYGNNFVSFTDNQSLDVDAPADRISTGVALSNTILANNDNDVAMTTTVVNGTLAVPGTANTNDSVIIHYDAGTVAVPEQAIVEDATTGAIGLVEQVYGTTTVGSLRLVDYNSTGGVFTDNNVLRVDQVIAYQNQVAGQVFSVGDVVVGGTSGATGRVLADTGTQLILADESGTWTTTEDLNVGGVKIAEANGTNTTLNVSTINIPNGIRTEQRPVRCGGGVEQGGIFDAATGLNIVRKMNSWYTLKRPPPTTIVSPNRWLARTMPSTMLAA